VTPEAPEPAEDLEADRAGRSPADDSKVMSFVEHLEELRNTILFILALAGVASIGGWFAAGPVLDLLVPAKLGRVYFSSPAEGFMVRFKASLVIGLLVVAPFILGRLWSFVAPGLFKHEKRAVVPILVTGSILFYLGTAFGYVAVVPRMVDFFLSFSGQKLTPLINVTEYFMFVAKFSFAFGLAFQLPLILVLLAAFGIVTPKQLWAQWRYGVIVIWIIAAWLTPPDAVSQIMMGLPLTVLYMLSIGVAFIVARRRRRRN
jgi:sec-independent protein translocase protein TatC